MYRFSPTSVKPVPQNPGLRAVLLRKRSNYIVSTMKLDIIRIGNSRGVRIPKAVFEQCGFSDAVELEVRGTDLILHNPHKPRQGWEEAFAAASKQGKDIPLAPPVPTKFDLEEWEW